MSPITTSSAHGRALHALLLAIPVVLVGIIVWVVTSSDAETNEGPGLPTTSPAVPTGSTPPVDLAEIPAPSVETAGRAAASGTERGAVPSATDDRPQLLRFEIVDATQQPAPIEVEVEYRIRFGDAPRTLAPVRFTARGPRVEQELPAPLVPSAGREVEVVVRRTGLRGEAVVPTTRATDTAWPTVVLHPTQVVRGLLVDARGSPVGGVPILMRDDTPGKEAHSRVLTDAGGAFAIDALTERANRLFVGDPVYPWVPAVAIDARNGPFVLEPIRVELHGARFRVQRADGSPAGGARLEGIGLDGGRFAVTVDAEGQAAVSTLLRGRWRVNASEASHGRASRAIEVPLASDEPVLILLPR